MGGLKIFLGLKGNILGREISNLNIDKYRIWWEWAPRSLSSLPDWIISLLLTIFLFSIGLLVAIIWKFYLLYINSVSVYIGLFGIFYAFTFARIQSSSLKNVFLKIRPIFGASSEEYLKLLDKWFSRLCNNKLNFILSSIVIISAFGFGNIFWSNALSNKFLRFMWFMEKGWYQTPLFPKLLILDLLGVFVFSLIATGARIFFLYIPFTREFSKLKIVVSPRLASIRFRNLSNFNLLNFFHWSICVCLIIISFSQFLNINIISVGIVILLTSIGALAFIVPQYCFNKNIRSEKERLINQLTQIYRTSINSSSANLNQLELLYLLDRISEEIYTTKVGIYDFSSILKLTGTFLIPIVTALLRMKGWI